jgi:hypothetical protein
MASAETPHSPSKLSSIGENVIHLGGGGGGKKLVSAQAGTWDCFCPSVEKHDKLTARNLRM